MNKFRFLTGGESHGEELVVIIDGVPSRVPVSAFDIDLDLSKRQLGYGRSERMKMESDRVNIISGVRKGFTTGAPLTLSIKNKAKTEKKLENSFTIPRPGHADLAGSIKYDNFDLRDVLERASARETASRVACGAVARKVLSECGMAISARLISIGDVVDPSETPGSLGSLRELEDTDFRVMDLNVAERMKKAIDLAEQQGESLGGIFEVVAFNVPCGLGSYAQWDRRLDGLLAMALMSIPGIKGVEFGKGFGLAAKKGSIAQDGIFFEKNKFIRHTNHLGGIEGGVSNGMPIVARCAMKPIPTLKNGLDSVDILTHEAKTAHTERADICAVRSASVVGEAMTAIVLVDLLLDRFGGDSIDQLKEALNYEKD